MIEEECWQAVVSRDVKAEGRFYYAVVTTGVYCRPGCGARLPKRRNVRYFASSADAEQAGFRACLRCRPEMPTAAAKHLEIVARACRTIEVSEELPSLAALAARAAVSRFHFHRMFKSVTGVTPKAYGAALRARRMRDALDHGATVTSAIYAAGFGSSGRFYSQATPPLGMTPTRYCKGGAGETLRVATVSCLFGLVLVAATEKGIAAIDLGDDREKLEEDLRKRFPSARLVAGDEEFDELVAQVVKFVERPETPCNLPLDIRGTAFQHRVWKALQEIPVGVTASYGEIAARLEMQRGARAVARACAANPAAIAVPCHRVILKTGESGEYRWGAALKGELLDRESKRKA
jgi:AraC family transcriptional regulator of adaptative response/methylated-DNA-[protein]-cysteine methyltransferase